MNASCSGKTTKCVEGRKSTCEIILHEGDIVDWVVYTRRSGLLAAFTIADYKTLNVQLCRKKKKTTQQGVELRSLRF